MDRPEVVLTLTPELQAVAGELNDAILAWADAGNLPSPLLCILLGGTAGLVLGTPGTVEPGHEERVIAAMVAELRRVMALARAVPASAWSGLVTGQGHA